jgi:glycosyltransferase involved in cell wall biosynthesis
MTGQRVLVVAHGHPDFSLGGGEIAAHQIFEAYRQHPNVEEAWLLARVDRKEWPTGQISLRSEGEYLWDQGMHDGNLLTSAHRASLSEGFADLLRRLRPTVVHAHHFAHLGLDYLLAIRRLLPDTRIFLTLHEFMAICRHNGQMVKTGSLALCDRATPEDCHRCFPKSPPEDFWLRREFALDRLAVVDGFIAPSQFLRQRYIDWGLPADRIAVIENCLPQREPLAPRPLASGERRNRFAFFGQINPYKGLDVLLRALGELDKSERREIRVEVHGAYLERQSKSLRRSIADLLEPLAGKDVLRWMGPYRPADLRLRMADADWVVVPSIWWENSPLVIQEAFSLGRPVISSDIGGMAEKIKHGVNGLHVPAGNARAWANALLSAARGDVWDSLRAGIVRPVSPHQSADAHLAFFAGASRPLA